MASYLCRYPLGKLVGLPCKITFHEAHVDKILIELWFRIELKLLSSVHQIPFYENETNFYIWNEEQIDWRR